MNNEQMSHNEICECGEVKLHICPKGEIMEAYLNKARAEAKKEVLKEVEKEIKKEKEAVEDILKRMETDRTLEKMYSMMHLRGVKSAYNICLKILDETSLEEVSSEVDKSE